MKGIAYSNKNSVILALLIAFGLASCTQPVVEPATDPGTTSTGTGTGTSTTTTGTTTEKVIYVVQLIASASEARANQVKKEFATEGYQAVVNSIEVNGKAVHRVQVGSYGTEADAQRVLAQMKRRYQRNEHVKNAVVKTKFGE